MLMALPLMVSCSNDDGEDPYEKYKEKLIGTWKYKEIKPRSALSKNREWNPVVGNLVLQINKDGSCSLSGAGSYKYEYDENKMTNLVIGDYKTWHVGTSGEDGFDCCIWLYYTNNKNKSSFDSFDVKFISNTEILLESPFSTDNDYKLCR